MSRASCAIVKTALLSLLITGSACGLVGRAPLPTSVTPHSGPGPTPLVTPSLVPQLQAPAVLPTVAPGPDVMATDDGAGDAWQLLREGLERRHANLLTGDGNVQERLYMLRVDPAHFWFDIGYKPGAPQKLMEWQDETGALIVANGGFFTAENIATGLVVVRGQASGTSYDGFGGMLAISDGFPEIRALSQQPYDPYEPLQAGLQSFPLLIAPDGQLGYPDEDGLADRRTVIAQDGRGRFLFIVASTGSLTLHQLSRYLLESDLDIAVALNLDGGASTGIQLAEPAEGVAPYSLLPIVITVQSRT